MEIKFDHLDVPYVDMGNGYEIHLEWEEISDEKSIEKAKSELRETPEIKAAALKELRELIENEKDFVYPTIEESLVAFLRPCKFYPKSAFQVMQKFFKFRQEKYKKVCENLRPSTVRNTFEDGVIKYFPNRDKNGCRVLYVQGGKNWKPSRVSTNDLFRAMQISLQAAMYEPMSQVNGISVIFDMEGLSMGQILHFTPKFAAMLLHWIQECVPIRLKCVYIINNSKLFNILFNIFKPFMSAKLRNRIHFLGKDLNPLTDALGKECLPKELNGTSPVGLVDGKVLFEFMDRFDLNYEFMDYCGYGGDVENRKKKVANGLMVHRDKLKENNNLDLEKLHI